MKSKLFLGAVLTVILIGGNIFAAGKPKVTMEEAQAVALKRIPGTVESSGMQKKTIHLKLLEQMASEQMSLSAEKEKSNS